jgi:hypothetical protein
MKSELEKLYDLMETSIRERKRFPNTPSAATVNGLEEELKVRSKEKDARLVSLISKAREETAKLASSLSVPEWKRPRYRGDSREGESKFYRQSVEDLKALSATDNSTVVIEDKEVPISPGSPRQNNSRTEISALFATAPVDDGGTVKTGRSFSPVRERNRAQEAAERRERSEIVLRARAPFKC